MFLMVRSTSAERLSSVEGLDGETPLWGQDSEIKFCGSIALAGLPSVELLAMGLDVRNSVSEDRSKRKGP